jgi:hypothetical protein
MSNANPRMKEMLTLPRETRTSWESLAFESSTSRLLRRPAQLLRGLCAWTERTRISDDAAGRPPPPG